VSNSLLIPFKEAIAEVLRIAVEHYDFGAGRNLDRWLDWDPEKGHVRRDRSPDEWGSLAEKLFDLELLKAKILDEPTSSFRTIGDHLPFLEALRQDPPRRPEWSGVFKKEGTARKCLQAFNFYKKIEEGALPPEEGPIIAEKDLPGRSKLGRPAKAKGQKRTAIVRSHITKDQDFNDREKYERLCLELHREDILTPRTQDNNQVFPGCTWSDIASFTGRDYRKVVTRLNRFRWPRRKANRTTK